jgi:hypothetical protein
MAERREMNRRYAADLADACPDPEAARIIRTFPDFLAFDPALVVADEAGIERSWEVRLGSGDLVVGRFDRLEWNEADEELIVTDYKSGMCWSFPTEPPQQLRLYGWAARRQWPQVQIVTLRLQYLGSRTQEEWSLGADDDLLRDDWVQEWVNQVKALAPPYREQPGSWCGYCGRVRDCAKGRAALAGEMILGEADAVDLAADCLVFEAAAARGRKGIDKWRRENGGEIRVGDMARGDYLPDWALKGKRHMKPGPKTTAEALIEALVALGGSLERAIRWDEGYLGELVAQEVDPDAPGAIFAGAQDLADSPEREALRKLLVPSPPSATARWRRVTEDEESD